MDKALASVKKDGIYTFEPAVTSPVFTPGDRPSERLMEGELHSFLEGQYLWFNGKYYVFAGTSTNNGKPYHFLVSSGEILRAKEKEIVSPAA